LSEIAFNGPQSLAFEIIRSEKSPMDLLKLQKTLGERLESLAAAGLTHLPLARSRVEFALEEAEVTGSATTVPAVHESASQMQTSTPDPQPQSSTGSRPAVNPESTAKRSVAKPISTIALNEEVDLRPYGPSFTDEQRIALLNSMSQEVAGCTRCNILSACRKQTVFGVGNSRPRLVFFGEAPGADEDRVGEPFVGAAGQLLDKIIEACKMKREDVYIMNTVKCRPPDNRNPTPSEMANCWEYAERQLEILQPEFICCLGRVAAQSLLKTESPIGHLRGKFFKYRDSQVIVTYHPAYLLRTESAKKLTWDDMRMLMGAMGIQV
jgi:DNA polymerase